MGCKIPQGGVILPAVSGCSGAGRVKPRSEKRSPTTEVWILSLTLQGLSRDKMCYWVSTLVAPEVLTARCEAHSTEVNW
ncbi:hypothetical protein HZ326_15964 [Fusarium oxysporum f. sp. albedinis]|nr:hypothetical protein HZ326_15964 [Fusarium oxysporum f. sp. albedinis]